MYGNMSSVEKALNKNDLNAYKNYDTNQYSLIPGMQHAKNPLPGVYHDSPGKQKNLQKLEQKYNDK